ncbi:MAG: hypothetical protein ACYCOU_03425 [Sulfobacillus sp.]
MATRLGLLGFCWLIQKSAAHAAPFHGKERKLAGGDFLHEFRHGLCRGERAPVCRGVSATEPEQCLHEFRRRGGRIPVYRGVHDAEPDNACTSSAMDFAAENGHLPVAKFLG